MQSAIDLLVDLPRGHMWVLSCLFQLQHWRKAGIRALQQLAPLVTAAPGE